MKLQDRIDHWIALSMPLLQKLVALRHQYIKDRHFTLILSVLVGFLSGLVAMVIKNMVRFIEFILTQSFIQEYEYILYVGYPLIGLLLTVLVIKRLVKQPVNPGIPNTLYAISKRKGIIKKHNMFSSILGSTITVGFGGSVGLEGPAVATTSAFASNLASLFKMNYKTKTLLIGCAASGAMASLLNAPIAALVFAIEVIMLDLTTASMIPLLMASASAAITSQLFLGDDILLPFDLKDAIRFKDIPFFVILGMVSGIFSVYFSKVYFFIVNFFQKIKKPYTKAVIGGISVGIILFVLPPLYGEGYETINALIQGKSTGLLDNTLFASVKDNFGVLIAFMIGLMVFKTIATSITLRAGGVGGIFAPSLFMGSIVGFTFSKVFNHFNIGSLSESNYTLVGMAGVMAGILHAPLTAIFLIAEITGGYELFIPLMITASISYLTVRYALPHSIYTFQLASRGELLTHDKDQAVLTLMQLGKEIETNFIVVDPYATLGDLVQEIAKSSRNLFPVVDKDNFFLGVVLLNDIRDIMFNREMYEKVYVHDLMTDAPEHIATSESMDIVMAKFEDTGAWNLPVLEQGKYVGFVSKSKLFSAYRSLLKDFYHDEE